MWYGAFAAGFAAGWFARQAAVKVFLLTEPFGKTVPSMLSDEYKVLYAEPVSLEKFLKLAGLERLPGT